MDFRVVGVLDVVRDLGQVDELINVGLVELLEDLIFVEPVVK